MRTHQRDHAGIVLRQEKTDDHGETKEFSARIYRAGINPSVDVPKRVSEAFGERGYVPVAGKINNTPIRATLVPIGKGRHRLYINGEMRKKANVDAGDRIHVELEIDITPRKIKMPEELATALSTSKDAKAAFEKLTSSRQKEVLTYLNWLKKPESVKRNIEKIVARLSKSDKIDKDSNL